MYLLLGRDCVLETLGVHQGLVRLIRWPWEGGSSKGLCGRDQEQSILKSHLEKICRDLESLFEGEWGTWKPGRAIHLRVQVGAHYIESPPLGSMRTFNP